MSQKNQAVGHVFLVIFLMDFCEFDGTIHSMESVIIRVLCMINVFGGSGGGGRGGGHG